MKCNECGMILEDGDKKCPRCGGKVGANVKTSKCPSCGSAVNVQDKFCIECGTPLQNKKEESYINDIHNENDVKTYSKKILGFRSNKTWKKVVSVIYLIFVGISVIGGLGISESGKDIACEIILLILEILPYICLSDFPLRDKLPLFKKHKTNMSAIAFAIIYFVGFAIIGMIQPSNITPHDDSSKASIVSDTKENSVKETTTALKKNNYKKIYKVMNNDLGENFAKACKAVGIDPDEISGLKKIDDWISGERYTFGYSSASLIVYCNADNTINSINLAGVDGPKIYLEGYESYNINDYLLSSNDETNLIMLAEDNVKLKLNYPDTADFKTLSWAFGRDHDKYLVSGVVEAKNAFGVEDELNFSIAARKNGTTLSITYFTLDGKVLVNNEKSSETTRKETGTKSTTSKAGEIVLVYDEKGEYGKTVTLDGEDYINYFVPEGTYKVINNAKNCSVYLASDKYYTNSDGYTENEVLNQIVFTKYGESKTITVKSGTHIELTIGAKVILEKQ